MSLIEIKAGTKAVAQEVQNNFTFLADEISRVETAVKGVQGSISSQTGAVKTDLMNSIGENKTAIEGVQGRVKTLEEYKEKIAVYTVYRHIGAENWYTVYSDGWCEQGGRIGTSSATSYNVEFPKEFSNNNIYISATYSSGTTTSTDKEGDGSALFISNVTTKGFRISTKGGRQNSAWEAKGQIDLAKFLEDLKEAGGQ